MISDRLAPPGHPARRLARLVPMKTWRSANAVALAFALLPTLPLARASAPNTLPRTIAQGQLVIAHPPPGATARLNGTPLHVGADGHVVFGAGRDETGPLVLALGNGHDGHRTVRIAVTPRDWPIERVNDVPPKTVNPPAAIAARITREQAAVTAARERDDAREDFLHGFVWPVHGRISGRFGNQRICNGDPRAPHSGMDIAVPVGTPVRAPAAGMVTFATPALHLTGGTVLIDHGFGLSSNFLHLSMLQAHVGERVRQGQVIALSGMTGRATGPHLHWGFNWFGTRLDPLLLPGLRDR